MHFKIISMKKNIFKFLIVLAILLAMFSYLVKPSNYTAYDILTVQRKINAISEETPDSLDVLFIGDSECSCTFSPIQLFHEDGFTSYNTGDKMQRISDGYAITVNTIKKQNVKLLVIEVNTLFRVNSLYNTNDAAEYFIEKNIPLIHYHSIYKLLPIIEPIYGGNTEYADATNMKGFWYRSAVHAYRGDKNYMSNRSTKDESLSDDSITYLKKFIELAKSNGINVILTAVPSPKNWNIDRHENIEKWANDNDVCFVDMNDKLDEIGIDWSTDTLDNGDHLNFNGSIKVNRYIGMYLKNTYDLPNHMSDISYEEWEEKFEKSKYYSTNS